MEIKAVIFDMDGTIIDSPLDFDAIREEIGLEQGADILQNISALPEPERARAIEILGKHEKQAAEKARLCAGAIEVLKWLREHGIKVALFTRNSTESVRIIKARLKLRMDAEVTRDDVNPKPSPEGVHQIAEELRIRPENMLMVGDYVFDMQTGKAAGAKTAFIKNKHDPPPESDYVLEKLSDIITLITGEIRPL